MNRLLALLASTLLLPACTSTTTRTDEPLESIDIAGIAAMSNDTGLTRIALRLENGASTAGVVALRLFRPVDDQNRTRRGSESRGVTAGHLIAESTRTDPFAASGLRYIDAVVALDPAAESQVFLLEVETSDGLLRGQVEFRPGRPMVVTGTAAPEPIGLVATQPKVSGRTGFKRVNGEDYLHYNHGTSGDRLRLLVTVVDPDNEDFDSFQIESLALSWSWCGSFGLLKGAWIVVHQEDVYPPTSSHPIERDFRFNDQAELHEGDLVFLRASVQLKHKRVTKRVTWITSTYNLITVSPDSEVEWKFDTPYPKP